MTKKAQVLSAACCVLCVLCSMLFAGRSTVPASASEQKTKAAAAARSELVLAGLRPGRDRLARAVQLYGKHYTQAYPNAPDLLLWADTQKKIYLKLELTEDRTINAVTVASYGPEAPEEASLPPAATASGLGLRLGDPVEKALHLYGPAYFRGPSSEGARELLLVVHKFNVSEDLPQVLETSYDPQTKKLVKITLSFPYY